eukprot:CAMPEP_0194235172 /NCGR_PEP_ID=MMETSP0158-20130606/2741_1 /TAXON_ID=33649 /ORGANISM="Thalassionema nitzschioides, Strain L26-B" /LENGTH=942 /DNA_ID=CAMNT_0038968577 /DNA_START=70 /DNA_END=2895 /DNA_ORIENTATION=-
MKHHSSRSCFSITRRYKSTLQQLEVEAPPVPPPHRRPDLLGTGGQSNFSRPLPRRWQFKKAASVILNRVKPGEMDYATFGQTKKLVLQACEYENPELATKLLDRLVNECKVSAKGYQMYQSVYNVNISAWAKEKKPEQAEKVFEQMLHGHSEDPAVFPPPDIYSYNALLSAWAGSNQLIALDRVLEILEEMEGSEYQQPDAYTYNTVMTSYANLVGEYGAAKAAEDILLRFSERHVKGFLDQGPQTISFNIAIKAWSNSGDEKGADRAHEIFRLMQRLTAEGHENVKPDEISLVSLIKAYAVKGDIDMVEELLDTPSSDVNGDMKNCFNCAISAYAMSGRKDAGEKAETILSRIETPDEISYKSVLEAHAKANRPDAASHCEDFLGRMVEKYLKYEIDMRPTKELFHIALRAWRGHHNKREAAERASAIVEDMKGLRKEWDMHTTPDARTYTYLIELWSQVDVNKAEEILSTVEEKGIEVWLEVYNMVIKGLVKQNSKESMETAMQLLKRLEGRNQAKTFTYNLILHGLAKLGSSSSAEECLEILNRMEVGVQNGDLMKQPNLRTYTCVLQAMSQYVSASKDTSTVMDIYNRMLQLDQSPDTQSKLDVVGYSAILLVLSRIRSVEAADAATDIIKAMLDPATGVDPSAGCMSSAVLANARAPSIKHTYIAHDMLVHLSRLFLDGKLKEYPYPSSFTAVFQAWSLRREISSIERGLKLLDLTKELNDAGAEKIPNIAIYNALFGMMAKSMNNDDGFEAEKILRTVPNANAILWNRIIQVWGYSKHPGKAVEAQRCLLEMQAAGVQPDVISFNSVLNAAAHTHLNGDPESKEDALKIALNIFDELKNCDYITPDHVTYGCIMKCYRLLTEPSQERSETIRMVLEQCKQGGKVGELCLRELYSALTPEDFEKYIGVSAEEYSEKRHVPSLVLRNLPEAWTINARR